MHKTLYIDVPGLDVRSAHRQVVATLTHYGFQVAQASTKRSRNVARVKVMAQHCAADHERAALLVASVLPCGTRVGVARFL
ncbi:hypothetical protein [Paraburkholderia phenoliruptrix]|uniref:hypothetical protein n=1 Tax=Paraburkholderia phenoliruptrix TaxID=252970 RepID=UPI002869A16E|nr:hypothetical protein [Paraburkholderia phenoliruptrix]WMY06772.1 hypothetical protein P3F88_10720 [Paraburkholderia phenoliruptrix]